MQTLHLCFRDVGFVHVENKRSEAELPVFTVGKVMARGNRVLMRGVTVRFGEKVCESFVLDEAMCFSFSRSTGIRSEMSRWKRENRAHTV